MACDLPLRQLKANQWYNIPKCSIGKMNLLIRLTYITTLFSMLMQIRRLSIKRMLHEESNAELTCLNHRPTLMNESLKPGSDPSHTLLEHQTPVRCGSLRRNWSNNPPLSEYAKKIQAHQSNCSLPVARHHFDNTFGLGSHLILWGQAMCNGMEESLRMLSYAQDWLWLDKEHCDGKQASPLHCYFPSSENQCTDNTLLVPATNITDPRRHRCALVMESEESRAMVRASSTEYLFRKVSPLVIQESNRQIGVIFPGGVVPEDLVSVHIRWGDKFWEMDLPPIEEYIQAVHTILSRRNVDTTTAHVYLATEDPRAYQEFMNAKPDGWKVYADITLLEINAFRPVKGNRASWAARNTRGRSGLVAMASLLVAMEANMFVLTTKSNWSTMINHLRTNIIDPRCGNCTTTIDLRPGLSFDYPKGK